MLNDPTVRKLICARCFATVAVLHHPQQLVVQPIEVYCIPCTEKQELLLDELHEKLERVQLENSSEVIWAHKAGACVGDTCPIHKRTSHPMRSFPQHWREDRALMERICVHGVGHPDLDVPDEFREPGWGIHGCCAERCCAPER